MHLEVVHDHRRRSPPALLFQPHDEWQEGIYGIAASKGYCVHKALMYAQGAYHGDGLASLVRQLDAHALLDPQSPWRHPQMERRLVDINYVVLRLRHELPGDGLCELLLLVF